MADFFWPLLNIIDIKFIYLIQQHTTCLQGDIMKTDIIKKILVTGMFISTSATASPDQYSLETDPATLAFNGYAAHLRVSPSSLENWSLGVGLYALDIPNFMLDSANTGKGWKSRLDQGVGLFAEYYLDKSRRGWFFGAQLAKQNYILSKENSTNESAYQNQLLMLHSGYRWYPSPKSTWYLQPWLGLGYSQTVSGQTSLSGDNFKINPLVSFATIHIGYEI